MRRFCFLKSLVLSLLVISFAASAAIQMNAVFNLKGSYAAADKAALTGMQLAIKQLNANGGMQGQKIQLNQFSVGANSVGIASVVRSLQKNTAPVTFAFTNNQFAKRFASQFAGANHLIITVSATDSFIPQQYANTFLLSFTDNVQAAAAAKFIFAQLHRKQVVVLYTSSTDAVRLQRYFTTAYKRLGGKIAIQAKVNNSLSPQVIARLKKMPFSAIYLVGNPSQVLGLVRQLRDEKIKLPIMGSNHYNVDNFKTLPKSVADTVYFTTFAYYDRNFNTDMMNAFVKAYKQANGNAPTSAYVALGCDAVNVWALAATKAKSTAPSKVAAQLKAMHDVEGVTGDLNFSKTPINPIVTIVKLLNGKATVASMIIPQSVPVAIKLTS